MRQKIANTLLISVEGVDLTTLTKIEFYVRQLRTFFQYEPRVIDQATMVVEIPKEDADKLIRANVELQFAFTDSDGNDDASGVTTVTVDELLKGDGYAY